RTGRAGRKGVCVLIVPHNERRRAERLLAGANVTAAWARPPSADEIVRRDRERILLDPMLSEPLSADERAFAETLLARYGGEQVAAAFLRLHAAGRSAPEELLDAAPPERKAGKRRDDFTGGVWFSLSVGHKQNAEARWLLPMLCRAGQLGKQDVGAIKVGPDETHVELAPGCVERFLEAIGPDRMVEKTIAVKPLEGAAPEGRNTQEGRGTQAGRDKSDKPHASKKPKKPWDKASTSPKRKKNKKQKAAEKLVRKTSGSSALKRKKLKKKVRNKPV
ncbi:MAG: DEAD/DEAH box helicase, partial [Alphaproteobacteria bacterium]